MRILLLGEFSALHKYLKEGLEALGHEVTLAANGDGYKRIEGATIPLYECDSSKYKSKLSRRWQIYKSIRRQVACFENYDIVQMINPVIFPPLIDYFFLKKIKRENGILCLAGAGVDYANVETYKSGIYRYYVYDYDATQLKRYIDRSFAAKTACVADKKAVSLVDKIVPYAWQYKVGYEKDPRCTDTLPMPVNTDSIPYKENIVNGKIVILHGLNREEEKGTPIIREALEKVRQKYQDKVEVIIDGHMPHAEYMKLMARANIVIDQCTGGGYGMGTLQAMALGKIVCADCWPEFLEPMGIVPDEFPGIVIKNTPESIYEGISKVIDRGPDYIRELGHRARVYTEEKHNCMKIAEAFLRIV